MWRVGILKQDGTREAKNFSTKEKCENWLLQQSDNIKLKTSIIVNKENIKERYLENWEKEK